MKFIVETAALNTALGFLSGAVTNSANIPILRCARIEATDTGVEFRTTDMTVEVRRTVTATIDETGSACVRFDKLCLWAKCQPAGSQIEFTTQEDRLTCRRGRAHITIQTLPSADFPHIHENDDPVRFDIEAATLKTVIEALAPIISKEETRYYLCGLHIGYAGKKLRFQATDGTSLGRHDIAAPSGASDLPEHVIVPSRALSLIRELGGTLSLRIAAGTFAASGDGFLIVSRLVDGQYPDLDRVIPQDSPVVLSFDAGGMISALQRVAAGRGNDEKGRSSRVVLTVAGNEVFLAASCRDDGAAILAEDVMACSLTGADEIAIIVHAEQFGRQIAALGSETVDLHYQPQSFYKLTSAAHPGRLALGSPFRA